MAPKDLPQTIGRYDVVDRLGYGGMGVVYRARDPRIGRAVAIKLLRVRDEGLRDRFLQEAQSAGSLKHRNIVTIYDFGEHDGQPYIVMELIEGITLSEQIRSNLPLSLPRKVELIEELAMGLEYAHNKGIVHRDVKPANIMIDRDGWLKILDFGIARVGESGMTRAGVMMGTPNYMSPEQVEGRTVDRRSDIFAVGLVAYEIIAYRQAFPGDTLHLVMNAIIRSMPPPLDQLCPGVDPFLVSIVNRAMQKDPARRYQTLAAMAADTARVRQHLGTANQPADASDTTLVWPPPQDPDSKRTPGSGSDRDLLAKRRAELIETHLRVARQEFDAADYAAAIDECERAILLEPDEPRAWALLERARRAVDGAELRKHLDAARFSLASQDVDGAAAFVARASQIDPASDEVREVQSAIAELKRRRERESERRALIAAALARAGNSLTSGDLDSAVGAANEVLIHDPANETAHELKRRALELNEERRAREKRQQEAEALVDQQRTAFAAGRRQEALEALQRFAPPHELVTATIAELRAELAIIERREREEDERRRREQVEAEERRQAQLRWVANQMERAGAAAGAGRFLDAIEILQAVQRLVPDASGLSERLAEARQGQASLEETQRRQRHVTDQLERAASQFAQGRLDDAVFEVDAALALEPGREEAIALRQRIGDAIDAERRQQEIDRQAEILVDRARRRFESGEHAAAMAMLESANPHPVAVRALKQLEVEFDEIERQRDAERRRREAAIDKGLETAHRAFVRQDFDRALRALDEAAALDQKNPQIATLRAQVIAGAEETRRQVEHDRRARAAVAEAKRRFAAGDRAPAIASLEQFDPPHPRVSDELTALRSELATLDRRERQERERARRAEEERNRKQARATAEREARRRQAAVADGVQNEAAIVDPGPSGALDASDTPVSFRPETVAEDAASRAAPRRRRPGWKATAAAAALIGVAGAGVVWKLVSQSGPNPEVLPAKTVQTTIQTTSISVVAATTSVPPVPPAIPTPPVDPVLESLVAVVRTQLRQSNLAGAAQSLVAGLRRAPGDARLGELSRDILSAASGRANDAKRALDRSGRTDRPQYAEGMQHMETASRVAKSGRLDTAVNEYTTAAQLFEQAARPVPGGPPVATTSVPAPPAVAPTTPTTTPLTTAAATTTAPAVVDRAPTTAPPTVQVVSTIDEATARRLLNDYSAAYRTLNVQSVRKVFPQLSDIGRRALETEQRDFSYCDYRFANVQVSGAATTARLEADGVKTCKPKIALPPISTPTHEIFDLAKLPSGSWVIVRQSTSY